MVKSGSILPLPCLSAEDTRQNSIIRVANFVLEKQNDSGLRMTVSGRSAPKVLVVDDDEDVQALVATTLREAEFTVATASTGWDALQILENQGFDC